MAHLSNLFVPIGLANVVTAYNKLRLGKMIQSHINVEYHDNQQHRLVKQGDVKDFHKAKE